MSSTNIHESSGDELAEVNETTDQQLDIGKPQDNLKTVSQNQNNSDEQSTSTGITSLSGMLPRKSLETITPIQEEDSLSSLDILAEQLLQAKKEVEDEDSFITIEGCRKDITTTTEPAIFFSTNERSQNIITAGIEPSNYPPPPPYEYSSPRVYQVRTGQTPVYQERYVGQAAVPQDASRTPTYRRNEVYEDILDLFDNKQIRNRFIQKVYLILFCQLILTFGFIFLCLYNEKVKGFVLHNSLLMILSICIYVAMTITLFCYEQTRRIFPLNFILLFLLTASMAYMMGAISCLHSTHIVLLTFGVSAGVCLIVSFIACQEWFDVTQCGMVLCLATLIIMVYGVVAMFITMFTGSNITYLIYACLITILFCMYLMYDTQQILGGRRIELSPEEYILGALTLYVDFMMIFQSLLYIFGSFCGN